MFRHKSSNSCPLSITGKIKKNPADIDIEIGTCIAIAVVALSLFPLINHHQKIVKA